MPPAGRVALRIEEDTACPGCGYNLRGLRLDALCPECGRPAIDTFARPISAVDGEFAERLLKTPALLLMLLALVGMLGDLVLALPAQLERPGLFGIAAGAGVMAFFLLVTAGSTRRMGGEYGISDLIRERLLGWWLLVALSTLLIFAWVAFCLYERSQTARDLLGGAVPGALLLLSAAAAGSALLLGAMAAAVLPERHGHGHARYGAAGTALIGAILLVVGAAVPMRSWWTAALGLPTALTGLVVLLVGWRMLVNGVREAQGSVASLKRRRRHHEWEHERPARRRG